MGIRLIGLDADDTLWHSEDGFHSVTRRFCELVGPYADGTVDLAHTLDSVERRNMVLFGYGVAYVMNLAMEPSFGRDIQFHHRPLLLAITFSAALLITLISAWVPARRAANVDLATALHYE